MSPPMTKTQGLAERARSLARLVHCGVLLALVSCSRPVELPPVVITDVDQLDSEVAALIERKVQAVVKAPGSASAHGSLGLAFEANRLWPFAAQSFAQAATIQPKEPLWRYHQALAVREAGDTESAFELLRGAAAECPNEAGVQQRLGEWMLERGDSRGAIVALQRALVLAPGRAEILAGVAQAQLDAGDSLGALRTAEQAVRTDSTYRPARFVYGSVLSALGRDSEAAPHLTAGVGAKKNFAADRFDAELAGYAVDWVVQNERASEYLARGRPAEAVDLWQRVSVKRPDDVQVLINLGGAQLSAGRIDAALETLARAEELEPNDFAIHLNRADCHLRAKRLDAALASAQRAVELGGQVGRTHEMLARILSVSNRPQDAYAELKRAVALDARDVRLRVALMETCMQLKLLDEALVHAQEAVRVDPGSIALRHKLVVLLVRNQRVDEGWAAYNELAKLAPSDERVALLREEFRKLGR